jgi:hypothetical protein
VYEQAKQKHPERWSRSTRDWSAHESVTLNPMKAALETSDKDNGSQQERMENEQVHSIVIKEAPLTLIIIEQSSTHFYYDKDTKRSAVEVV